MSSQPQPQITSKNLSYSSDLPPFLARLRGHHEQQRDSDSPDPILAARRRAVRPRSKSEEAEDAPLVVDEAGNAVTFSSGADAEPDTPGTKDGDVDGKEGVEINDGKDVGKEKEKVAEIGASKKRKVGRVVGGDGEEEDEKSTARATGRVKGTDKQAKEKESKTSADAKSASKQGKKKAKKIKLSFGDDGD
ncbi:hypothetical protein F5Y04DRAFT_261353 [Hypomontagnella monticulosa]|nr:hypothetical protein F5Y04DRAFT_261353 [Hypomontagnella monticulosa]